jgi:hypothetical protein
MILDLPWHPYPVEAHDEDITHKIPANRNIPK